MVLAYVGLVAGATVATAVGAWALDLLTVGELLTILLLAALGGALTLGGIAASRVDRGLDALEKRLASRLGVIEDVALGTSRRLAGLQLRLTNAEQRPAPLEASSIFTFVHSGREIRLDLTPGQYIHRQIRDQGGFYERALLEFVEQRFRPGLTICDVGANVGNHAVFFGALMDAQLICFEASPLATEHLRRNLDLNGIEATVVEEALGAEVGRGALWVRADQADNLGAARMVLGEGPIRVSTLDRELSRRRIEKVDLIKLDVEGMEADVLRGAHSILERHRPELLVELGDDAERDAVSKALIRYGYQRGESFNATPTYHFFVPGAAPERLRAQP